ncbi:hypothetical protein M405DRAFT_479935 [Rhizopogon salebrosus TDB-379]|nr:hypothetical protein M405DRAFT_479935 [Rhizopogon salebrosus TDB-379]
MATPMKSCLPNSPRTWVISLIKRRAAIAGRSSASSHPRPSSRAASTVPESSERSNSSAGSEYHSALVEHERSPSTLLLAHSQLRHPLHTPLTGLSPLPPPPLHLNKPRTSSATPVSASRNQHQKLTLTPRLSHCPTSPKFIASDHSHPLARTPRTVPVRICLLTAHIPRATRTHAVPPSYLTLPSPYYAHT